MDTQSSKLLMSNGSENLPLLHDLEEQSAYMLFSIYSKPHEDCAINLDKAGALAGTMQLDVRALNDVQEEWRRTRLMASQASA